MLIATLIALSVPFGNPANNVSPRESDDRVICQRETPTGSIITSRKLCMTKAEWNALERDYKEGGLGMIEDRIGRQRGT